MDDTGLIILHLKEALLNPSLNSLTKCFNICQEVVDPSDRLPLHCEYNLELWALCKANNGVKVGGGGGDGGPF